MNTMLTLLWLRARKFGVYALALIAGLMAAWAAREHVQQKVFALEAEARVPVVSRLVAAFDLEAGTKLEDIHLAVREIPAQWASSRSLEPEMIVNLVGTLLNTDVPRGETISTSNLVSAIVPPTLSSQLAIGRRAVTLPTEDLAALAGMVRAGDLLDLYVSFSYHGTPMTMPLLQGIRVLTVGGDGSDEEPSLGAITLDASPEDAVKLVAARQTGTLTAMLRNAKDTAPARGRVRGNLEALMGMKPPAPPRQIKIVYGDRADDHAMQEEGQTVRVPVAYGVPGGASVDPGMQKKQGPP